MSLVNPVIVVPGITASELRDEYSVSPETVWSAVLNKDYERLMLHPDDARYELREPSRIAPDSVFGLVYGHLIEELRYNLSNRPEQPVPVFPFPYDWRQPLERIELQLKTFVEEVIARTRLLKHYHQAGFDERPKVNLVGHSMGGLIIAGYLEKLGQDAPIGRVVSLGTPFRGSLEAPLKIITGTASLGEETQPASREREAARLTPALYHLLPSFDSAIEADPEIPDSLYDADAWQPGVLETLAEFIRRHGLRSGNVGKRRQWAQELLSDMLAVSARHRQRIEKFRLDKAGLEADDWLCLVGVDATTRVRLRIQRRSGHPVFELTGEDRCNYWDDRVPDNQVLTGDGTVPFLGAIPSFLDQANLVCLRPADFGYWEVRDRLLVKASGFHGMLPNLNLAHRLIVSHFRGKAGRGIWGRPAPGVTAEDWKPPIAGLTLKR